MSWYKRSYGYGYGLNRNIGWFRDALSGAWGASKKGESYGDWNRIYSVSQFIPVVSNLANAYNALLQQNKVKANTGVGIEDYNDPSDTPIHYAGSAVQGSLNQMVGFSKKLDNIYGDSRAVDAAARRARLDFYASGARYYQNANWYKNNQWRR